jgi:hypothetical protein
MDCAALVFGSAAPQFEQTELLPGFSVPQLLHLITLGGGGGAFKTCPAARALPSARSPPHCEQVVALPALRVPQNPQWMSAPAFAALIAASSLTIFCSEGSSNFTSSGCGAPQLPHVCTLPLLRPPQFGHVHSFSTNPTVRLRPIASPY